MSTNESSAAPAPPTEPATATITAVESTTRLVPGAVIEGKASKYRIELVAKAGGMGETYRATDLNGGRSVLVKLVQARFLKAHAGGAAERIVKRFEREIAILRSLKGEVNVVALLDEGFVKDAEGGASRFMVQEFIVGSELRRLLREGAPMARALFAKLGAQLVQGMAAIHERGQSHRDVKPENVMVGHKPDGTSVVKYIDFGLGRPVFGAIEQVTHLTDRLGPAAYVAPELSARMGEIRDDEVRCADVYSVAALLWRMATGSVPFPPGTPNEKRRDPPLPSGGVADEMPQALKETMRRCLLPRPLDRPKAAELRDAFVAYAATALRAGFKVEAEEVAPPTEREPDRLSKGMKLGGRYRIDDKLGEGSMGVVYRATDLTLKRVVAVKAAHDKRALVTDEAENLARVEHQNIVRVIDVGEDDGVRFIVMEYVGGRTLAEMLADGTPLRGDLLREVALGLVDGVRFAHGKGVLHNDLGPNNVKWDSEKRTARILDFGISVGGAKGAAKVEATNLAVLTPDQLLGVEGEASDVYQIGILLYLMTTGREPYLAEGSIEEYKRLVLEFVPPSPLKIDPKLEPPELSAVVMRCLAKKPEDRFPSAEALFETLVEVFKPKARTSKTPAVVAAILGFVVVAALGMYFAGVGPFAARPQKDPVVEFFGALNDAPALRPELGGRGVAPKSAFDAQWLVSEPIERLDVALVSLDPARPDFWASATEALPAAEFERLARIERRRVDRPEAAVETLRAYRSPAGLDAPAPSIDGVYEDVVIVAAPTGDYEAGRVRYVRDVAAPTARLSASGVGGAAGVRPFFQIADGTDGSLTFEASFDDGVGLVVSELIVEPPDAGVFKDATESKREGAIGAATTRGARLTDVAKACLVRAVGRDVADRTTAAAPPPATDRATVLPARVIDEVAWTVDGARRAASTLDAVGEPVVVFAAAGTKPTLDVRIATRALPDGVRLAVRATEVAVDGSAGADVPLVALDEGGLKYAAPESRGRRRLKLSFFALRHGGDEPFALRDRVRDVVFTTEAPRSSFAVLDARGATLDQGSSEDGREIVLAPGERLRVAGPEGMKLEAAFEGGPPAESDRVAVASASPSIAEVSARVGGVDAPWSRKLKVLIFDPAAATPHETTLVVSVAPFGLSARGRAKDGVLWRLDDADRATCFVSTLGGWPTAPIDVSEGAAPSGAVWDFAGLERVSSGWQVVDRAAPRIETSPRVRAGGRSFPATLSVDVDGSSKELSRIAFVHDADGPGVVATEERTGAAITTVPYDRDASYAAIATVDDGESGAGVSDVLVIEDKSGAVVGEIRAEPSSGPGVASRRFRIAGTNLKLDGARYVARDVLGNASILVLRESARPAPVSPEPPKPPPPLTKDVVDARARVAGLTLLPVAGASPPFRMMEFELTVGNVRKLGAALSKDDPAFLGVSATTRTKLAELGDRARGVDDAPIDVGPTDAELAAEALGLKVPTVKQWMFAARGDASTGFPRRAQQGEFLNYADNGANLGTGAVRGREWFTVRGRHDLLSMAGNVAEVAKDENDAYVWVGGDCGTSEPPAKPVLRRPRFAGARLVSTFP